MTSIDFVVLVVLALWFLFSGFPLLFALLQSPGETKDETASSRRTVQWSSRQSLSYSVSNCVFFLENGGYICLSSLLHVTFYILCKKIHCTKKEETKQKDKKDLESSSSQRVLFLTELHRTQKFMWLRPWNSSDQVFSLSCKDWVQGWGKGLSSLDRDTKS